MSACAGPVSADCRKPDTTMSPLVDVRTIGLAIPVVMAASTRMFPVLVMVACDANAVYSNTVGGTGNAGAVGTNDGLPREMSPFVLIMKSPPVPPVPSVPGTDDAAPPAASSARAWTEGATVTATTVGSSWQAANASKDSATPARERSVNHED